MRNKVEKGARVIARASREGMKFSAGALIVCTGLGFVAACVADRLSKDKKGGRR